LASTFLGGAGWEQAFSLTIDDGNIYIAGRTSSSNFPITYGAYDTSYNGGIEGDCFISKLDSNLQSLLSSTFLGGTESETVYSMCINGGGNVYVVGDTRSSNFPVTFGAYDTTYRGGISDGFVSSFDNNLANLLSSTFIGGSDYEVVWSMSVDKSNIVYVCGWTYSSDFPTTLGAFDTTYNGTGTWSFFDIGGDIFISKFDVNLQDLLASTFLGGTDGDGDESSLIFLDANDNVYVAGMTHSSDFPVTPGAYDTSFNGKGQYYGGDTFISKLDSNLSKLSVSTFFGGCTSDVVGTMILNSNGDVYIAGYTESSNFPVISGAWDITYNGGGIGEGDAFLSKFDSDLSPTPLDNKAMPWIPLLLLDD